MMSWTWAGWGAGHSCKTNDGVRLTMQIKSSKRAEMKSRACRNEVKVHAGSRRSIRGVHLVLLSDEQLIPEDILHGYFNFIYNLPKCRRFL